jgi:hypothetical protein
MITNPPWPEWRYDGRVAVTSGVGVTESWLCITPQLVDVGEGLGVARFSQWDEFGHGGHGIGGRQLGDDELGWTSPMATVFQHVWTLGRLVWTELSDRASCGGVN